MVDTGHSVALSRHSHLFSTMSSLHDVLVHDKASIPPAQPLTALAYTIFASELRLAPSSPQISALILPRRYALTPPRSYTLTLPRNATKKYPAPPPTTPPSIHRQRGIKLRVADERWAGSEEWVVSSALAGFKLWVPYWLSRARGLVANVKVVHLVQGSVASLSHTKHCCQRRGTCTWNYADYFTIIHANFSLRCYTQPIVHYCVDFAAFNEIFV
jgi:hypothetical protein